MIARLAGFCSPSDRAVNSALAAVSVTAEEVVPARQLPHFGHRRQLVSLLGVPEFEAILGLDRRTIRYHVNTVRLINTCVLV